MVRKSFSVKPRRFLDLNPSDGKEANQVVKEVNEAIKEANQVIKHTANDVDLAKRSSSSCSLLLGLTLSSR
jgi:hypothetical protein